MTVQHRVMIAKTCFERRAAFTASPNLRHLLIHHATDIQPSMTMIISLGCVPNPVPTTGHFYRALLGLMLSTGLW